MYRCMIIQFEFVSVNSLVEQAANFIIEHESALVSIIVAICYELLSFKL